jgi:iron complex outermembrane receptor protein
MTRFTLLLASTILAAPVAAQQSTPAPPPTAPAQQGRTGDDYHTTAPGEIVVTANFLRELDILSGTSVLSGTDLVRDIRPQIGDTLARLPGVSATSFSPARRGRCCAASRASACAC